MSEMNAMSSISRSLPVYQAPDEPVVNTARQATASATLLSFVKNPQTEQALLTLRQQLTVELNEPKPGSVPAEQLAAMLQSFMGWQSITAIAGMSRSIAVDSVERSTLHSSETTLPSAVPVSEKMGNWLQTISQVSGVTPAVVSPDMDAMAQQGGSAEVQAHAGPAAPHGLNLTSSFDSILDIFMLMQRALSTNLVAQEVAQDQAHIDGVKASAELQLESVKQNTEAEIVGAVGEMGVGAVSTGLNVRASNKLGRSQSNFGGKAVAARGDALGARISGDHELETFHHNQAADFDLSHAQQVRKVDMQKAGAGFVQGSAHPVSSMISAPGKLEAAETHAESTKMQNSAEMAGKSSEHLAKLLQQIEQLLHAVMDTAKSVGDANAQMTGSYAMRG
jgi:hypothetical protein